MHACTWRSSLVAHFAIWHKQHDENYEERTLNCAVTDGNALHICGPGPVSMERDQNTLLAVWGLSMLGNVFIVAQGLFPCFHGGKHWVNVEGANDLGTNTHTNRVGPFQCHVINYAITSQAKYPNSTLKTIIVHVQCIKRQKFITGSIKVHACFGSINETLSCNYFFSRSSSHTAGRRVVVLPSG